MAKYRKKTVTVDAFQWTPEQKNYPEWLEDKIKTEEVWFHTDPRGKFLVVGTFMMAGSGDYVIKETDGEVHPCKADIFAKTYEKVVE